MSNVTEKSIKYFEKKAIGKIRQQISSTNSRADLNNGFSFNVSQYLNSIMEPEMSIYAQDISFSPEGNNHYILSDRLIQSPEFSSKWEGTRLPHFIQKVADTTYHRYIHLSQHGERTRSKIKKGQNLNPRSY